MLQLVNLILNAKEFEIKSISEWQDIYSVNASFNPDLIILDINLNGIDGRDICKELRKQKDTEHIPIILYSAHGENVDYNLCNAQAFITKPFEISHLVKTIEKLIAPHFLPHP